MKVIVRFRDFAPTPELLDHIKRSIARALEPETALRGMPHPLAPRDACACEWIASARISFVGEHDFVRCRLELHARGGGIRIIEAMSDDALIAVDAVADRLELLSTKRRVLPCAA